MASLKLFINESASSAQNGLVTGFFSLQGAPPVTFQQGDNGRAVELHFLSENPDTTDPTRPFVYNTPPAAGVLVLAVQLVVRIAGAGAMVAFHFSLSDAVPSCVLTMTIVEPTGLIAAVDPVMFASAPTVTRSIV